MKKKNIGGSHPVNNLQQARVKASFTQEYAAELLDCGTRSIQGYEEGRCDPPLSILQKMIYLYQCEFSDLYPDSEDDKPPPDKDNILLWLQATAFLCQFLLLAAIHIAGITRRSLCALAVTVPWNENTNPFVIVVDKHWVGNNSPKRL